MRLPHHAVQLGVCFCTIEGTDTFYFASRILDKPRHAHLGIVLRPMNYSAEPRWNQALLTQSLNTKPNTPPEQVSQLSKGRLLDGLDRAGDGTRLVPQRPGLHSVQISLAPQELRIFYPFSFWVPLLKPNSRKKGTLIIKGLLGNLVKDRLILRALRNQKPYAHNSAL